MTTINAAVTDSSITIFRGLIASLPVEHLSRAQRDDLSAISAVGKESIEAYQNAKLDAEFDLIMQRHGHTIEALNNR
ncbi:type II toxin-antitoxin system prevent-host-death family antitoxin [Pectobacterium brasiliense]|uniref:type II toxin-antitoxin system prevent-host-death family antitoxin n=1 Tax=Pectobacterium brasiliense TaxID=180957 RepID=UPI001F072244|nr:type II toxin-antitoxin system prevent-host-death family antitoxin [Pectobacterium brasiliense]